WLRKAGPRSPAWHRTPAPSCRAPPPAEPFPQPRGRQPTASCPDLAISWRCCRFARIGRALRPVGAREAIEIDLSAAPARSQELNELLEKVRRGELMPDTAEAEAERLGLGKLVNTPDPLEFDPTEEAWWTLPMVIAWIACHSLEIVREYW